MTRLDADTYRPAVNAPVPNRHAPTPDPDALAAYLERLARQVRQHGAHVVALAEILAARGWPASTLGTGARSSDTTSSTERAAGLGHSDDGPLTPPMFAGLDERLGVELRHIHTVGLRLQDMFAEILSHASDADPVPAGTGSCTRCPTFCRPTPRRPHNRIKSGLCPSCYTEWHRAGKPDRSAFLRSTPSDDEVVTLVDVVAVLTGEAGPGKVTA